MRKARNSWLHIYLKPNGVGRSSWRHWHYIMCPRFLVNCFSFCASVTPNNWIRSRCEQSNLSRISFTNFEISINWQLRWGDSDYRVTWTSILIIDSDRIVFIHIYMASIHYNLRRCFTTRHPQITIVYTIRIVHIRSKSCCLRRSDLCYSRNWYRRIFPLFHQMIYCGSLRDCSVVR